MAVMIFSLAACKPKVPSPHSETTPTASPESHATGSTPNNSATSASQAQFDIEKIPVSENALPPFPYLDYPAVINIGGRFTEQKNFDSLYIVTGKQFRKVEGRVESHKFYLSDANMSETEARRNYENLITQMGGIKVNDATPSDLAASSDESSANEKKTRSDSTMTYDAYLVRTPDQMVWIVLMLNDSNVKTLVVAEQPFKQTVTFITADNMQSQLDSAGHVALYINFDTDKASIRPDAKPAVDEITKLLEKPLP